MRTLDSISEVMADLRVNPDINWYAQENGKYNGYLPTETQPSAPTVAPTAMIGIWEFRNRFTTAELQALLNKAYDGDAMVRLLLLKIQTASDIDLLSSSVIDGVNYLKTVGVLTVERTAAILMT